MSRVTSEINRITGAIIGLSIRLIFLALFVLLLHEGVIRGYEFGHEIFYASAAEPAPGRDKMVNVKEGTDLIHAARLLKDGGLIANEYSFIIQAKFFNYKVKPGSYALNTSMTSKEILQMMNGNTGKKDENQ